MAHISMQEFMVINHTGCGMLTFKDEDLRDKLKESTKPMQMDSIFIHSQTLSRMSEIK